MFLILLSFCVGCTPTHTGAIDVIEESRLPQYTAVVNESLLLIDSWNIVGVNAASDPNATDGNATDENATGDDEEDEPWEMDGFQKVWLQVGWIIQAVMTVLLSSLAYKCWPYKRAIPASRRTMIQCDCVSEFLYETLWGENELSSVANGVIIFVGFLNLLMFSCETELRYNEDARGVFTDIPLSDWVTDTNYWVQAFSVAFVIFVILLRMKGAQAHPKLQRYGGFASWKWFMGSVYAHIEILAILPSAIDLVTNNDWFANLIWITLIRSVSWVERQPSTGRAIRQFRHMLKVEGPLLVNMFIFACILWVLLSGFYFIANYDNPESRWEAAIVKETGEEWQRFESIPSTMFFVLINLVKENPLAEVHETLWSRLLVMSVCFVAVPLFAMPAGVLGSTLQRYVLDVEEEEPGDEVVQQDAELADMTGKPTHWNASFAGKHLSNASYVGNTASCAGATSMIGELGARPQQHGLEMGPRGSAFETFPMPQGRQSATPFFKTHELADATYTGNGEGNDESNVEGDEPDGALTCWERFESSWPMFIITCTLSFGSVFVYFFHTASAEEMKEDPDYKYCGMRIIVDVWLWAWVDGCVAIFFAVQWLMSIPLRGVQHVFSFDGFADLLSWVPGGVHFALYIVGCLPDDGHGKRILNALCVFRLLKPERYCGAFRDMASILSEHSAILKATFFMTFCLWIGFSAVLYYTERDSTDGDMRENYGAMGRSLWAEAINLHGEWVWCDYSAAGKGVCTLIALFSSGVFMVPIAVFSDGYQDKLGNMDDADFDVQPWQGDARPEYPGARQQIYDLLFCHLHLQHKKKIRDERRSLRMDAIARLSLTTPSSAGAQSRKTTDGSDISHASSHNPQKVIDQLVMQSTRDAVESPIPPKWGFVLPPRKKKLWGLQELTIQFQLFRATSVCMTFVVTFTTIALTTDYFSDGSCKDDTKCRALNVAMYAADALAVMFFSIEFMLRVIALPAFHCRTRFASIAGCFTSWHFLSIVGLCDMLSLGMLWLTLTNLRSTVFRPETMEEMGMDDLAVPLRLLRLFCLENYFHAMHVFSRVTWINRGSLVRAGYSLLVIWYMFGTVLYLFEHNPKAAAANAARKDAEMIMAQRYPDVLTGLQYALVHLTGDYPITEYGSVSQIMHLFAIVFGMCTMAAFTGVFVAGYTTYYKSERVVERKREAERRLQVIFFTVLACQRKWRAIVRKRAARRIAAAAGVDIPSHFVLAEDDAARRHVDVRQAQLKGALQGIFQKNTPEGAKILLVFQLSLVINVISNIISTMPEVEDNGTLTRILDFIEFATGYVFLAEYSLHILSANKKRQKFMEIFRLIDLFCLLPTFWRLWFVGQPHRWQKKHYTLMRVIDLALIVRVVRVLDFPYVRRTRKRIGRSIATAFEGLLPASVLALTIWVFTTSVFSWCESMYGGPEETSMKAMPDALYWTSIFIIGEWANVDFSPGAGSRMCIFYCLFGVATFAVPVGLMMEAVESTIVLAAEQEKQLKILMTKSRSQVALNAE